MAGKIKWSEERIERLEAEGRGKGTGANYRPWVQVQDFSSSGHSRRAFSRKTGRVHHFLSDVEWHLFLLLEHSPSVVDIREQYPLPRDKTLSIAAEANVKHPMYPGTKVPAIMTCDMLVTQAVNGRTGLAAYSCKRADGEIDMRVLEKLEIERRFFALADVAHYLVFHTELPAQRIKNLAWCRGANIEDDTGANEYEGGIKEHAARFTAELGRVSASGSLAEYCSRYDTKTGSEPGTGLRVARALLWDRKLVTDFNQPDLAAAPMAMFRLVDERALRVVGI